MNLALEKGERVTTGGKGRGEIGGKAGEVTGVVVDEPTTDGLGKRYGTFSGWGMAAGKRENVLLKNANLTLFMHNAFIHNLLLYILKFTEIHLSWAYFPYLS